MTGKLFSVLVDINLTVLLQLDFSKLVKLTYGEDIHENEKILVLQKDYFNTIGPILNGVDKG